MVEWLARSLSLANVIFALLLGIYCIKQANRLRGFMKVLMLLFAATGLYWFGLYVFVFLTPVGIVDPVWFGQIFVRPAFTFTLGLMASMAVYRWRGRL